MKKIIQIYLLLLISVLLFHFNTQANLANAGFEKTREKLNELRESLDTMPTYTERMEEQAKEKRREYVTGLSGKDDTKENVSNTDFNIASFFSFFLGAFVLAGLLTRGANRILRKTINNKNKLSLVSFMVISFLLIIVISKTVTLADFIVFYLPSLMLWLLYDLYKNKKL